MSLQAAAILGVKGVVEAGVKRAQEKKLLKAQKKESLKQIDRQKQISPQEAQAMARLRKGAESGTVDVSKATSQIAQPLYQQAEAQEARAMGNITAQGLEGSIIAQEVSRKIGSDVRAEIANQARSIAMQNEQTKAEAEKALQASLFKRGELMRQLAMKRAEVKSASTLAQLQSRQDFGTSVLTGFTDIAAEGVAKELEIEEELKEAKKLQA
tara:strand:+ start:1529 stop:2164 length:636 start_codon:yes stop_codon:yes gene_type:complete